MLKFVIICTLVPSAFSQTVNLEFVSLNCFSVQPEPIQAEIFLSHQNSLSLNMAVEKSQRERGRLSLSLSLMLLRSGKVKVLQKQVENALTMPLPTFSAPSPHHQCSNLRSRPHLPLVSPPPSSIYHLSIFTFVANLSSFFVLAHTSSTDYHYVKTV